MSKEKHYTIDNLIKTGADYLMGIGERSNGKTYAVKHIILFGYHKNGININGYLDNGNQGAIIRRWEEDYKGAKGSSLFNDFIDNTETGNIIEKHTKGQWNSVYYFSQRWYLCRLEDGKRVETDETPFCYAFALSSEEHYKSNSYPKIKTIFEDEFLTRNYYLPDEFVKLTSILSTIIRERDDVKIFMMGNTVNKYSPYFNEMGLKNVKNMKKGTIDVYKYGESGLSVAIEYTDFPQKTKKSDKYFAFDNPKLRMITSGEWELNIYPHLPYKYNDSNVVYFYFICFDGEILMCKIINVNNTIFTYIHRKSTPIHKDETHIIYQQEYDARKNYKRKIIHALSPIEKKIVWFFQNEKVFYQDNEVGEIVRNYIEWCRE